MTSISDLSLNDRAAQAAETPANIFANLKKASKAASTAPKQHMTDAA
jgi:hypothetical protein